MNSKYFIRPIQQADGTQMVAILYNGEYTGSEPAAVKLTSNNEVLTGEITMQDTGAFLGPVANSVPYQVEISENGETYEAAFTLNEDGKTMDFHPGSESVAADLDVIAPNVQPTATVTYTVHKTSSTTTVIATYSDLFKAINKARLTGSGAVVKMNGTEVFMYGVSGRYYKYQYTAAYGYVTSTSAADQWLSGYQYSYIIPSNTGRIYGANYKLLKGAAASWALEPNSGGYYYQYAQHQSGYKKASMTVNMSQAKLRLSDNTSQPFVAYVFINVHNSSKFYDLGLVFNNSEHCWKTISNPETGVTYSGSRTICNASKNASGEWVADGNVTIEVETTATGLEATITNQSTKASGTITVTNSALSSTASGLVFTLAASYVPSLSQTSLETPDYRCGGYFKNIQFTNCKVYTASGASSVFFATSASTSMALVYNTDCCAVTSTSSSTTINIAYNRAYTN